MTFPVLNSHPHTASDPRIGRHRLEHFCHLRKHLWIEITEMNLRMCGNKHPFFMLLAREWGGEDGMKNGQFSLQEMINTYLT